MWHHSHHDLTIKTCSAQGEDFKHYLKLEVPKGPTVTLSSSSFNHIYSQLEDFQHCFITLLLTAGSEDETVLQTCGRLCSVKSCKCFEKMIWSSSCYIDFYVGLCLKWIFHISNSGFLMISETNRYSLQEYGLQVDSIDVEPKKGVFSIYFVVMVLILILLTASFALYKMIINCGRKQAITSVSI